MADEIGNMKAMREALEWLHHDIERQAALDGEMSTDNAVRIGAIREALAAPARNCDVGTAEEQVVRFDAFVRDRRMDMNCTGKCPAHNGVDFGVVNCVLQWAQMPYEEGGSK